MPNQTPIDPNAKTDVAFLSQCERESLEHAAEEAKAGRFGKYETREVVKGSGVWKLERI